MKISKKELQNMINEELKKILEGPEMGKISVEDLVAEITITLENLLQELRPDPETAEMAFAQIKDSIDVILNKSLAGAMRVSTMIKEELKRALDETDVRDPMSPTGDAPSDQAEMFDRIKDNLTHAIWLLENEEEMSRDVLILIDGAHRRALELMGRDSKELPYNM